MKKIAFIPLFVSLIFSTSNGATMEQVKPGFAKNVIFLIPNGSSSSLANLARWTYNEGKPLNLDSIASGMVRTHSADSPIADTISAANAMATGWKTQEEELAYTPSKGGLFGSKSTPKGEELYPVASILEAAKLSGKAVGLVVTSEIQNATPGAFTSHVTSWDNYSDITEQQVYQDMDVVLGGGLTYLKKNQGFHRGYQS